jgi:hypothetical protein
MRTSVSPLTLKLHLLVAAAFAVSAGSLIGQDAELTNYKSGIDVIWGGTKGTDYYEEYFYHDKLVNDAKVVYIKSTTPITMSHNARNNAFYHVEDGGLQIIGANGKDGVPNSGDEGIIRYKIDRDRQYLYKWSDSKARTQTALVLPAYTLYRPLHPCFAELRSVRSRRAGGRYHGRQWRQHGLQIRLLLPRAC